MRVATEAEVGRDGREQEGVEDQVVEVEEPARPGEREHPVVDGRRARGFAEEHQGAERSGRRAVATTDSVADWEGAGRIVDTARSRFGRIDILVTCAGILRDRMVFNMSEEEWDAVLAVHLKGTFACVRHACTHMREQRWGRIITF